MKMSSKFTCRFCKEQFDQPKGLYKHLQTAHSAGSSRDNRTCPICGVLCSKYEGYRDHLLYIHGQSNEGQKLTFKSLNEFLLWKTELEIKYSCKYVLQSAPKVLSTKEKKYFYQCDGVGAKPRDKKIQSVVMKTCSSVISVVEGTGVFKVEYWDTHSGHTETAAASIQNELEAAISSVEMVNAIGDSDDSFDRSEEYAMASHSSSITPAEKQTFLKPRASQSINNLSSLITGTVSKIKTLQTSQKADAAKKKSNSSVLYSLASVACGKGISKKSSIKSNSSKTENQSNSKADLSLSKNNKEKVNNGFVSTALKNKNDSSIIASTSVSTSVQSKTNTKVSTVSTSPVTTKTMTSTPKVTVSGPLAIAPKITTMNSNTINSLFSTNSVFPNQLVLVNPVGMDQNSLNSSQNVITAGQNILFSLPLGQNILPATSSAQSVNQISVIGDKKALPGDKAKPQKETGKVKASNVPTTPVNNIIIQNASNALTSTITSTAPSAPVTITSGINNTPVLLSSLPVGSTFMSVNNNLIPIASPSGNFLPTSLPPNIVLTPVPNSTMSNAQSVSKTTFSSSVVSVAPQIVQTQMRFSAPSPSITVSSIVREPVYSTTPLKHMSNNILTSSNVSPISSTTTPKSSKPASKAKSKTTPVTVASRMPSPNSIVRNVLSSTSALSPIFNQLIPDGAANQLTITPVIPSSPVSKSLLTKARKRTARNIIKPTTSSLSTVLSTPITTVTNTVNTKAVNSSLNMLPRIATGSGQVNSHKPGTLLFESSGEIFMLEPIDSVNSSPQNKNLEVSKMQTDMSVQTVETSDFSDFGSKLQKKRLASAGADDAIMMKVKCYQLEMQYLNSQTECKRLKIDLTKERLKNAELSGEKVTTNAEETSGEYRNKAQEIMKEIEDSYCDSKDPHVYRMTKTSVLRSLYEDLEELCGENNKLHKELENYRAHDKFYKSLKKRLYEEDF